MQRTARTESGHTPVAQWRSVTSPPDHSLRGVVTDYSEFREQSTTPVYRSEMASAEAVLIVEFEDPLRVSDVAEPESERTWHSFAAGLSQGPTSTTHAGTQHCIEVRFTPLGSYRLFGLAMNELSDRVVGLDDLLGRSGPELVDRLAAASDWAERFDVLDRVFTRAAAEGPEPDDEVAYTWNRLQSTSGSEPIGAILSEIGWSRGRLAQRFSAQAGLTPKAAAKVLRFRRAADLLTQPGHRSLASIALTCGYYDQAHFNRDFRALAGCSPTAWIAAR